MFNNDLRVFESTISILDVWLEISAVEGFDAEACSFAKSYTKMIGDRIKNLYFIDESNSELYRVMHVNKNMIQREILNPDAQPFVFPLPVPVEAQ